MSVMILLNMDYKQKNKWLLQEDMETQKLNRDQVKDLKKKRDSNIVWLAENWIYKELHPYIRQACKYECRLEFSMGFF
jgi:hypothetical protein